MKVGDYVRTKDGAFGKIIDKYKIDDYYKIKVDIRNGWIEKHKENLFKKYITKSSPNIIDLIEVGDFINKQCIVGIKDNTFYTSGGYFLSFEDFDDIVETIVTKEQFSSMEYKVGDDKE